jgi:hypothetical protein
MSRLWALVPLLMSSGCLFLDDINHAPTVTIADGITTTNKGGTLTIVAQPRDPEDGALGMKISFGVSAVDGAPLADCDYSTHQSGDGFDVTFFRAGTFRVTAVAEDSHPAISSTASVMVTITDAKPAFVDKAKVVPTSLGDACHLYAAGDVVTLALSGPTPGVPAVADADAGARATIGDCAPSETLSYTWRISDWPGGAKPVLTAFDGLGCTAPTASSGTTLVVPDALTQVCLWTDPTLAAATAMYSVVLDVSDGTSTVTSPVGDVPVSTDEPPCITGTNPVAGSYVVDRSQLQEFDVDGVVDDRDRFDDGITFAWSVWRQTDPTWRPVPSWNLSTYQLDVSSFGVGEQVRVRVEALDRTMSAVAPAVCAVDADDCTVASCASMPDACHKWKTWDLELR